MTSDCESAPKRLSSLYNYLSDQENHPAFLNAVAPPPDEVHSWLANLVLLNGVPFEYLVPDETMLPAETLRFFFVDENWVERMIDGAISVVARTGLDQLITETLNSQLREPVREKVTAAIRTKLLGQSAETAPEKLNWPITGFLIRSQIVANWKGLEIENTSKKDPRSSLSTLRLDQPAKGVLLGLYNGQLGSITFKHPPEALHFGIDGQENSAGGGDASWAQNLRDLKTGLYLDPKVPVDVKFRGSSRTIDVVATANAMKAALPVPPAEFTSAEFAIQMIESPKSVTFELEYQ